MPSGSFGKRRSELRLEEDDGQGGGERQLETDVEQAEGIDDEEGEGAQGDGVEDMGVLPEQPAREEGDGHDDGPEDRGASLDEQGVEDEGGDEDAVGHPARDAGELEEREEQERDDGDVGAGDGEQVVEARPLEGEDGGLVHPAVVAEEQGLEDGALAGYPGGRRAGERELEPLLELPAEDRTRPGRPTRKARGPSSRGGGRSWRRRGYGCSGS